MPERHSTVVGGSSAARIVNCPGSTNMLTKVPEVVNRDSFYSIEGTALHTATEMLITGKMKVTDFPATIETRSGPFEITEELVNTALLPAMAYWDELLKMVDTWILEAEVEFPGIDGAFGTTDVIARDDRENITYVTDWKFGTGVGVTATYPMEEDPELEIVNEQLLFYACGARRTYPELFPKDCKVVLTIVQPRARDQDPITWAEVTTEEMDTFEKALGYAVKMKDPPTKKGRWCAFQACRTVCPHHTGALFDLQTLSEKVPAVLAPQPTYTVSLLDVLNAAPAVEALIREARSQAHILLGNGLEVPGWKLVAKRGTRQWTCDEKDLPKKLKLKKSALYDVTLKSPAGVEKVLPKGVKLPAGITTTVSSGTTIAPETDKRPAIASDPEAISKILLEALGESN